MKRIAQITVTLAFVGGLIVFALPGRDNGSCFNAFQYSTTCTVKCPDGNYDVSIESCMESEWGFLLPVILSL